MFRLEFLSGMEGERAWIDDIPRVVYIFPDWRFGHMDMSWERAELLFF